MKNAWLGSLEAAALRGAGWLRRSLIDPEWPTMALEVRPRSLGIVRLAKDGRRLVIGSAAWLELPEGAVNLSMTQHNIVDAAAFKHCLTALLEKAGVLDGGRVGLVLPDPVARLALVPSSELGRVRSTADEMIRFRLRKAVPFEIRDARLASLSQPGASREATTLVAAIYRPILEDYEHALAAARLEVGLVELSALALLGSSFATGTTGDQILVNWDHGYVSFVLTRDGWPILIRTLSGVTDAADVAREAAQTLVYHKERLGGAGLRAAALRSGALPSAEALGVLSEALGLEPALVAPWGPLAFGDPELAQPLAGAAAVVSRRAAA